VAGSFVLQLALWLWAPS